MIHKVQWPYSTYSKNIPVVWTRVGYVKSGEDAGVWGTRTDTPDSLQNIKIGEERNEFVTDMVFLAQKKAFKKMDQFGPFGKIY